MVGMEMRNDDGIHLGGIEARSLHVLGELADGRGAIAAKARVEQHELAAAADSRRREGVGELIGTDAGGNQGLLDLVRLRVLDITFNATLGAPVMQAENLDVADLVFEAVGGALGVGGADEGNGSLEAEHQAGTNACEHKVTPRDFKHVFLLEWPTSGGIASTDAPALSLYTRTRRQHGNLRRSRQSYATQGHDKGRRAAALFRTGAARSNRR